ncbi:2-oxoglutarate (2OG) and Fe(II)-dependent oxygenase superfamily protein [Euphorbia peplus]|nr:2-oxoglutarate (2OG) and Fe(II)-dependent oxygenase superfamily protein [Euphorbia peplus]
MDLESSQNINKKLAKKPLLTVPPRYLQPDLELHKHDHVTDDDHVQEVPVIDFQRLYDPDSMESELSRLHFASKHWGFFQLVNHGVSSSLLEKMKSQAEEFFKLPMEEKKRFWQYPGEMEGFGQLFVVSEEQKLEWSDMFLMVTHPLHLRKPHLFPNLPLPLRETIEKYSSEVKRLAVEILDQMGKALKIKAEEMKELTEEIWQSFKINYYPACPEPDKVIGVTPHSDGGALTILLQLNDTQGLQIMKDDKWIPINPLPIAFVVNIGDMMEMISNGEYKSIKHRATVNYNKERFSIATFHSPRYECEVGPASSLITKESPPLYTRITVLDCYKSIFSRQLQPKSYHQSLRIQYPQP